MPSRSRLWWFWSWKWIVLWSLWAGRVARQPTPVVRISSGDLRGSIAHDGSHAAYLGIPYASLSHKNRFKAPDPEQHWNGVLEAIDENISCKQEMGSGNVVGSENCLIVNVYVPLKMQQTSSLMPVMVYIHGGGFYTGSGNRFLYGPEYLISKGVILVTLNYRLNIQGFLCLRTKDAPGNAGLKDQVAGLKWVQRNIAAFGGNPNSVTIFGESAGAASVSYHLLSPMSSGLFHRAITESGSAIAPWANQLDPVYTASLLAKTMGYTTEDAYELYKVFSSKTDEELLIPKVTRKQGNIILSEQLFAPCVETKIEGEDAFLTELPFNMFFKGDFKRVPMIIGTNSEEGFLFSAMENQTELHKIKIEKSLPKDLVIASDKDRSEVAAVLEKFYTDGEGFKGENKLKWSRFYGEPFFTLPSIIETELVAKNSELPVYSYLFSYSGWRNVPKMALGKRISQAPGASHLDELFYIFSSFGTTFSFFERNMIETMTTLWTDFAKTGRPTKDSWWSPVQRADPQALVLSAPRPSPARYQPLLYTDSLRYWHGLYSKFRRKDY